MRTIAAISLLLLLAADARAERPPVEWSSWFRVGYRADGGTPRAIEPRLMTVPPAPPAEADAPWSWETALGLDLTLAIGSGGDVRLGAWAEARSTSHPVAGGELLIGAAPAKLDLFWYQGEGVWVVRAGGNDEVWTGAVSYGYRAPWALWGPWSGTSRYMIGVRLVAGATRSRLDPTDWSATAGIEVEPIGAIRYLLGIQSWYR